MRYFLKYNRGPVLDVREVDGYKHENRLLKEGEIVIPEGVETVPFLGFWGKGIKKVTLPEGIKVVGSMSCSGLDNLEEINLPKTVEIIDERAFSFCSSLKEITLPEGVVKIDAGAFNYCKSLKEIVIPSSVNEIGRYAFANCYGLTKVEFKGDTNILSFPFDYCHNLTEIIIPYGAEKLKKQLCYGVSESIIKEKFDTKIEIQRAKEMQKVLLSEINNKQNEFAAVGKRIQQLEAKEKSKNKNNDIGND